MTLPKDVFAVPKINTSQLRPLATAERPDTEELNGATRQLQWSTKEKAIGSVRFVLSREVPHIISAYDNLAQLTADQRETLKDEIYKITYGHFQVWGLRSALKADVVPHFHGSHIDALMAVFDKLDLNPLGFSLDWSTKDRAVESIQFVLARQAPHIMASYDNIERLNPEDMEKLRTDVRNITSGYFQVWGLGAALSLSEAPYFNGSYIDALLNTFDSSQLGLSRKDFLNKPRGQLKNIDDRCTVWDFELQGVPMLGRIR